MQKVILKIDGMTCSGCSANLENHLNKQKGIVNATVNLVLAQASIEYEDNLTIKDLDKMVAEAGFKSLGVFNANSTNQNVLKKNKIYLIIFTILAIVLMYIAMGHMLKLPNLKIIDKHSNPINYGFVLLFLTILFLIYGFDIIKSGFKNMKYRTLNMDTLVTLGVLASFIYSLYNLIMVINKHYSYVDYLYFESSAMVIYFIKLGRFISFYSKEKTKDAIAKLVQITPQNALLKTPQGEKTVSIAEVKKGDILICKPGMKIAVDGVVKEGSTHVDESFITGEAKPVKKEVASTVIAGSINYDGKILYEAQKIGKDSTISQIVTLVMEATNAKMPITKIVDKISRYFVPIIIFIAILTFGGYLIISDFNEAIKAFVTVLVVACPCSLGLATPMAVVVGVGLCAKKGIIIKNNDVLENTLNIDTVVFDKTGTLTYGNLKIAQTYNFSNYTDKELFNLVASLEKNSTHPIAQAFATTKKVANVKDFQNISGIGLKGTINNQTYYVGNAKLLTKLKIKNNKEKEMNQLLDMGCSILFVIENKTIIGLYGVKDIVRKNIREVITALKKQNIDVLMLTGDNLKTAQSIGKSVGITKIIADVLPETKNQEITKLLNQGKKVMMVGDGINDAPSLVTATIGVSLHSATDIASDASDVVLINNDLNGILNLLNISRATIKNIKQNLFWAFFYNILMVPVAIGFLKPLKISLNPMLASLAMVISSLTVVLNALRLKGKKNLL